MPSKRVRDIQIAAKYLEELLRREIADPHHTSWVHATYVRWFNSIQDANALGLLRLSTSYENKEGRSEVNPMR